MFRESGGCVEQGFSKKTVRCNYPGQQMSGEGGLSWMLLYDDLVGVVTSHVTKMAVTPLYPPWRNPL